VRGRGTWQADRGFAAAHHRQEAGKIAAEVVRRAVPILVVAGRLDHDRGQLGRHLWTEPDPLAGGRFRAGQHHHHAAAKRPKVAFGVGSRGQWPGRLGEAEVGQLHAAVDAEQDVGQGEVAVGETPGMGSVQGGADLQGGPGRPGRGQVPTGGEHVPERGTLDQLDDHEPGRAVPLEPVDRGDVRVVEAGDRLDLALEPGEERLVGGELPDGDLQRDTAVLFPVARLEHHGRPADAQGPDDLVPAAERLQGDLGEWRRPAHQHQERCACSPGYSDLRTVTFDHFWE